jgi:DNA transposition AAA+ family ATPase
MKTSGTYISRAFTNTFTGDVTTFEDAAREMLRNEFEARRANETVIEHGFLVEPMADFLNTTKHSHSIGVVWCDPGKGKSKALEVYRRKDKLCVLVTATKHMSGWRALRDAILDELPNKRRLNGESWDKWIVRNFRDTGRLLIIDNAHLLTAGARHWLAYDWHDETKCPVALIGNEEIVRDWKKNAQHESRVGVAYEVKPKQRPNDTVHSLISLHLPAAAEDAAVHSLAVQILRSKGACRAVEKHLLIAADLVKNNPDRYDASTALRAANNVLLTDVRLAA